VLLPAKFAVSVALPVCEGVRAQVAAPVLLVVAVQLALPKVKVTVCPETPDAGLAETSDSEATTLTGCPIVAPCGLVLSDRNVTCLPAVQVTGTVFEVSVVPLTVAVAVILSPPA
jgi:hypothetical protein